MGADIYGWVETLYQGEAGAWWESAICIPSIVYRSYPMFASLFGVRNGGNDEAIEHGRFRAIAPGRGAPPKSSQWYTEERDLYGGAVGETWVLWSELAAIDWEEEGKHEKVLGWEPPRVVQTGDEPPRIGQPKPIPAGRRERRGDYLTGGWATLFKLMAVLAEQIGADNVRLSVWFDQW